MRAAALSFLLIGHPPAWSQAPHPAVGFVSNLSGKWRDSENPKQILRRGQALPAGARLKPEGATEQASIIVVLYSGEALTRDCGHDPGKCQQPLVLPERAAPASSFLTRLSTEIGEIFASKPDRYIAAHTRSAVQLLQEAVISPSGEMVNFVEARTKVDPPDELDFEVKRLSDGRDIARVRQFPGETKPVAVSIVEAPSGLYEIRLSNPGSGNLEDEGLVLVAGSEDVRKAFDEARRIANGWIAPVTVEQRRAFLRTVLAVLERDRTGR